MSDQHDDTAGDASPSGEGIDHLADQLAGTGASGALAAWALDRDEQGTYVHDQAAAAGMLLALCDGRYDDVDRLADQVGYPAACHAALVLATALAGQVASSVDLPTRDLIESMAMVTADQAG